jgi:hypothetical protein
MRYKVLMVTSTEMLVFWDAAPCGLVDTDRSSFERSVNICQTSLCNVPEDGILTPSKGLIKTLGNEAIKK